MTQQAQIFLFRYHFTCMSISLSCYFINPLSLLNTMSFHGEGSQPMTLSFTQCNNFDTPITKLWHKHLITPLYVRLCYMIPIPIFSFYKWGNRFVDAKNSLKILSAGKWLAFSLSPDLMMLDTQPLWLNCTSAQCLGLSHLSLVQYQKTRLRCRVFKVPHFMVQVYCTVGVEMGMLPGEKSGLQEFLSSSTAQSTVYKQALVLVPLCGAHSLFLVPPLRVFFILWPQV